jgi:hypothetical protein
VSEGVHSKNVAAGVGVGRDIRGSVSDLRGQRVSQAGRSKRANAAVDMDSANVPRGDGATITACAVAVSFTKRARRCHMIRSHHAFKR